MKKLLSILLAVLMVASVVPMSASAEESTTYEVGDIIEFGSYPQSIVADATLITELNALAPEWEDWTSYGYYTGIDVYGTMKQGDWMRYTDVVYNGNKYRGVKFTQYRPYYTIGESSLSYTYQDNNGYSTNTVYWFKFESIDWRILDPETGLVICETIIDSQPYSNTIHVDGGGKYDCFNGLSYKNYASDYETSSIRQWLNADFYNTAFSSAQQNIVKSTTLNNDGYHTSNGTTGSEALDSNETNDKIFLLSYNEVRNSNYGFNSSASAYDAARQAQGSDYAKSQGLSVSTSSSGYGNSYWLLRTPGNTSYNCCFVGSNGVSDYCSSVHYSYFGVRPALRLKLNSKIDNPEHTHSYGSDVTKQPTHLEFGETTYTCACGDTYTEVIAKLTGHTYEEAVTAPTCTAKGYTTYTCACGDSYVDNYTDKLDHEYTSEVTTEPTHLTEGVKTFICECGDNYTEPVAKLEGHTHTSAVTKEATHLAEGEMTYTCACGDTYTEAIAKLTAHTYEEVVTAPTCTSKGYTTYTCACGDSYVDNYTDKLDHEYTSAVTTEPTHLTEGVKTFTCKCGDTYTEPVAKLEGHTYTSEVTKEATHLAEGETTYTCACGDTYTEAIEKLTVHTYEEVVTAPTCTAQGYTTYTCACGDSYVNDYVSVKEHSYSSFVTTPATHTKEGVLTYTCSSCGDSYTAPIAKNPEHAYTSSYVVAPTCEEEGYTAHVCDCGDITKDNYTEKTGHSYNGRVCEHCGKNCSCMCHYSGFMSFIWKIFNFFYKLFKVNKICACGVAHF